MELVGNVVKNKNLFICSDHFQPKDFLMQVSDVLGRCRRTLKFDAIPSQEGYFWVCSILIKYYCF